MYGVKQKLVLSETKEAITRGMSLTILEGVNKGDQVSVCGWSYPNDNAPKGMMRVNCVDDTWQNVFPNIVGCEWVVVDRTPIKAD